MHFAARYNSLTLTCAHEIATFEKVASIVLGCVAAMAMQWA